MSGIEKIDKNFEVKTASPDGMVYFDCTEKPFEVNGLLFSQDGFLRMPQVIADSINGGVKGLNCNTAGGRVRFVTDSRQISIRAKMRSIGKMPHFALTGSAGFDLYADNDYEGTFVPPFDIKDGYQSTLQCQSCGEREITINFPLYSGVVSLQIGLCAGASLKRAKEYADARPVVYYGSSITQGGCASRPGNSYQSIISRRLRCDYVNLGFSGSARGEEAMAEYISGLSMSAFVYDYDYNAPDEGHLQNTHARMFNTVRAKNPQLPIIMLSCPQSKLNESFRRRRDIIMRTYMSAREAGDNNVYFIDGGEILNIFGGDSGTVDNCHPNDLGFACMAKAIGDVLQNIL